ncbi:hypothetical protein BAUCODRAFT_31838 [Baudoinia panamericana UAMH 10762]|uniref:Uncharacterized protein n=1 Tax=Baudoinia panamericana (strain UAMH 10762) TaxID=717646 RepID=M2NEZ2_BAUPA|nr:uncharacterized protein BAUCODRAFT_31838 [Baudoinia panamericana UAMH 10762]EMC97829.1 hypothetical protein BAUCODRAFT_31838 [Baudoinia panamericana UAMH 10762]
MNHLPAQQPSQRSGRHARQNHILVGGILQLLLRNSIAAALNQRRPCTLQTCINLRHALLQDPFFDRNHRPEELETRLRPPNIQLMDCVLLMARLMRVFMWEGFGALTAEQQCERLAVRNEALNQPFFDKERVVSVRGNPFVDDPAAEDEGCFT